MMELAEFVRQLQDSIKGEFGESFAPVHGRTPTVELSEGDESDDEALRDTLESLEISGIEIDMFPCGCPAGIKVVVWRART